MSIEIRDRLRQRYGTPKLSTDVHSGTTPERAFVIQSEQGRTVITAPIRETALKNDGFLYLHGRFVEADSPNGNGALWTTEDLQLGEATVAGGPLNWLHDDSKIIGTLLDGNLVAGREAAALGVGNHITSTAAVWRFLFPHEANTIERAAAGGQLFYSMECVSREVACVDSPGKLGCDQSFSYADYDAGRTCAHLKQKTSVRRFVDPIFLGGAVIVPPVQPGWANAEVNVMRQAAALVEQHGATDGVSRKEAEAMTAQILQWANRDRSDAPPKAGEPIQQVTYQPTTTTSTGLIWNGQPPVQP